MESHCSTQTLKTPHDLIASIEAREHQFFIEVPEPWNRIYGLSPSFPKGLVSVLQEFIKQCPKTSVSIFAPDAEYSQTDLSRLIYLRRRKDLVAYERMEFLLSPERITELLGECLQTPGGPVTEALSVFQVFEPSVQDVFVCVHGARDQCCGLFGKELYHSLRGDPVLRDRGLRIFRCSHIGGHRYAPTFLEASALRCWGQATGDRALQILQRSGEVDSVLDYYRGSALLADPLQQVAEREMLRRYGWDWFSFRNVSYVTEDSQVLVRFENGEHRVHIERAEPVALKANCDEETVSMFPQYRSETL